MSLALRIRAAFATLTGSSSPTAFDAAGRGGSAHGRMESAAGEFRHAAPAARGPVACA